MQRCSKPANSFSYESRYRLQCVPYAHEHVLRTNPAQYAPNAEMLQRVPDNDTLVGLYTYELLLDDISRLPADKCTAAFGRLRHSIYYALIV
jgi:hypothetical protein